MRKQLKAVLLVLAALLLPTLSAGQTALTQTTTSGIIGSSTQTFTVASVTGITGFGASNNAVGGTTSGNGNTVDIYIDRELMQVVSVNTAAKSVSVLRGQGGSQASAHASGTIVLAGPPGAFFNYDPEGYCGGTGAQPSQSNPGQYTPWVNQRTGAQWLCSTITKTWVPGFSGSIGYSTGAVAVTTAVASATTILPSGPLFHLTGTTPVTTITTPVGCNATAVGGCTFTVIADTGTSSMFGTGGNLLIGAAITTLTGNQYTFVWDATNSKWAVR